MLKPYNLSVAPLSKYLFFTGKGGVGKTSVACATAVGLADQGKKIMLISTDPASNLQDVFDTALDNKGVQIKGVPNLTVANFDPEEAAAEYRESVVAPYRGKLPDSVVKNMEEQLSGSCTVEIAAFNEFTGFITDEAARLAYDHILFDTAPTGHTLRMLQLPSAWTDFIAESTHGASCLGQLAGLDKKKQVYAQAVDTLADGRQTTLLLVARPETAPLAEAERASGELKELGIHNQVLIVNGLLKHFDDGVSKNIYDKQCKSMNPFPDGLASLQKYEISLKPYGIAGIVAIRAFLNEGVVPPAAAISEAQAVKSFEDLVENLHQSGKRIIFTMGKGGVGKTTVAAAIASALAEKGEKVHLTTTDPAAHLKFVMAAREGIMISSIDEKKELARYQEDVLGPAREIMSEEDLAYLEEDLRSPCTQEIAVFRAFAEIVENGKNEIVVIDTAPTGHTLLLLDATLSYHREVERTQGQIPDSVRQLLPRLRNHEETEVVIITLAEMTPVYEASRLADDLTRYGIQNTWWVVNGSLHATETTNETLKAKAAAEIQWINRVNEISAGNTAVIGWREDTGPVL